MPRSSDEPSPTAPSDHAGRFAWLADLDTALYGLFGLGLLGFIVYEIGRALWATGSLLLIGAFVAVVGTTLASALRDLRRRQFSWASRGLLVAWGLCVSVILIVDVTS